MNRAVPNGVAVVAVVATVVVAVVALVVPPFPVLWAPMTRRIGDTLAVAAQVGSGVVGLVAGLWRRPLMLSWGRRRRRNNWRWSLDGDGGTLLLQHVALCGRVCATRMHGAIAIPALGGVGDGGTRTRDGSGRRRTGLGIVGAALAVGIVEGGEVFAQSGDGDLGDGVHILREGPTLLDEAWLDTIGDGGRQGAKVVEGELQVVGTTDLVGQLDPPFGVVPDGLIGAGTQTVLLATLV